MLSPLFTVLTNSMCFFANRGGVNVLPYLTAFKTPGCKRRPAISAGQIKKKQSTNIKRDEINIMNIINDNTLNLQISPLNDNSYMKVTLK